jgi:L,D-transpeptidase YbiS
VSVLIGPATAPPAGAFHSVIQRLAGLARDRRWQAGLATTVVLLLAVAGTGYRYSPIVAAVPDPAAAAAPQSREQQRLLAERARLASVMKSRVPRGAYIVIDQTHNNLRLMRGETLLLEAPCSAGSGMILKEGSRGRVWVFDTPRGVFEVLSRAENPVWRKPDWAFVEEGQPIPRDPAERLEYGSLGEYALHFGDGYMVHGTLYERLIGRPVSHGCIRLGREPLRELWKSTAVGTPIYIY